MTVRTNHIHYAIAVLISFVAGLLLLPTPVSGCCGVPSPPHLNGFGAPGPRVTTETQTEQCDIVQPDQDTPRFPVVLWVGGLGTSAEAYQQGLEHIASHGFVVANIGPARNALEDGEALLSCLDSITDNPSVNADVSRVAAAGHSLGGSSAVFAGTDSRVRTTIVIQPILGQGSGHDNGWNSSQEGPVLLLAGEQDKIASLDNIESFFSSVNTPVFAALSSGADHFTPLGDFGYFAPVITGWLSYQLFNHPRGAELFEMPEQLVCNDPDFGCEIRGTFE